MHITVDNIIHSTSRTESRMHINTNHVKIAKRLDVLFSSQSPWHSARPDVGSLCTPIMHHGFQFCSNLSSFLMSGRRKSVVLSFSSYIYPVNKI